MSLNAKVKVIWKTTCQWRDHAHWPKRRDIKLPESETGTPDSLRPGDAVKVKFGSRWYNAEVAESWEPKAMKAKKSIPDVPPVSTSTVSVQRPADITPVTSSVLPSDTPGTAEDPYAVWVAEQKTREKEWATNRAAKNAKIVEKESVGEASKSISQNDELSCIRKQLEAKTEECTLLKTQLRDLQHANVDAVKNMRESQERFCKMVERIEDSVAAIEDHVTEALIRIEQRLESLEKHAPLVNMPMNAVAISEDFPDDLTTIDVEALASLSEVPASPLPVVPTTPVPYAVNTANLLSKPVTPSTPVLHAANTINPVSTPVSEDLIRGCVTPRKVQCIQKVLEKEKMRHRCALKLLPFFFSKEELNKSNTDGSHGKERLDATKLNSLKVLVFSKFPIDCPVEKEKSWRNIKGRINSKCRAAKFANISREN